MKIILKNIPAKTQRKDIKDFLEPTVKGGWLNKTGEIKSISILQLKSTRTRTINYHGLVEIHPDSVAERVIRKLHKKVMSGKFVAISEYKIRNQHKGLKNIKNNIQSNLQSRRIVDRREDYEFE